MAPFANIFKLLSTGWNVKLFSKFNELSATGTGWNENLSEVWWSSLRSKGFVGRMNSASWVAVKVAMKSELCIKGVIVLILVGDGDGSIVVEESVITSEACMRDAVVLILDEDGNDMASWADTAMEKWYWCYLNRRRTNSPKESFKKVVNSLIMRTWWFGSVSRKSQPVLSFPWWKL